MAASPPIDLGTFVSFEFFVNDLENPYTTGDDKPFLWIRGRQVGGK